MKKLISILLLALLPACNSLNDLKGSTTPVKKDWSQFVRPPAGTPLTLRVFYRFNMGYSVINLSGKWGDEKPYIVSFPIITQISNVVRIEMHFKDECIFAKNFNPAITFKAKSTVGIQKNKEPKDVELDRTIKEIENTTTNAITNNSVDVELIINSPVKAIRIT